jgi:hypothetical protein
VSFHRCWSSTPSCSNILSTKSHSKRYSLRTRTECIFNIWDPKAGLQSLRNRVLFYDSLRNCFEKIRCQLPSSDTVFPRSHLLDQNRMLSPLPTTDSTATLKRAWAFWGIWIGRELSVLSSQSHLMRRGHPKYSRSWIPSPPYYSGILTRFQETRQFPPFAFSWTSQFSFDYSSP